MKIHSLFKICLNLFILFCSLSWSTQKNEETLPKVIVSITPYKYFVERIAGSSVSVEVIVPTGANLHSYEPSPKQMIRMSNATVWFQLGESFEKRGSPVLQHYNPALQIVDLRKGIDLISGGVHCCCCAPDAADLHLWLSPKLAKIQVETIAASLLELFPEQHQFYIANLQQFLKELDALDKEIENKLASLKNRYIFVSHPAYAYFCRDYQLIQIPIEFEGKDPSSKQLIKTIELAKEKNIRVIYSQKQYSDKSANIVAREIGAKVIDLDPYEEDYFLLIRGLAKQFTSQP